MTTSDLHKIEQDLSVRFTDDYAKAVLAYPFLEDQGTMNWSLGDNADSIIMLTQQYRSGYVGNPKWPHQYVCIGLEGDGCPLAMNVETTEVIKVYKGNIEKEPMERYDNFGIFFDLLLREWNDYINLDLK